MPTPAEEELFSGPRQSPPDDGVVRELAFERMLARGFKEADEGRTVDHEELSGGSRLGVSEMIWEALLVRCVDKSKTEAKCLSQCFAGEVSGASFPCAALLSSERDSKRLRFP